MFVVLHDFFMFETMRLAEKKENKNRMISEGYSLFAKSAITGSSPISIQAEQGWITALGFSP